MPASASSNVDPLSVAGANVPGFPVGEDLSTHTVPVSETHVFGGATVNDLRAGLFPQRVRYGQAAEPDAAARLGVQL